MAKRWANGMVLTMLAASLAAAPAAAATGGRAAADTAAAAAAAQTAAEAAAEDQHLPRLNLQECLRIALANSLALASRAQEQDQAGDAVTQAYGAFLPSLSVSRTWQRSSRTDFDVAATEPGLVPLGIDTAGDTLFVAGQVATGLTRDQIDNSTYDDYRANANLNLFEGGGKFSALGSARAGLQAARDAAGYAGALVIQDVSAAYFDLLRYQALQKVAVEARDLAARELERSETYFRLGSAAKSDVLQAKVRLENTRLDLVRADNAVAQAFAQLAYTMGRPLEEPFGIDASPMETDFALEALPDLYSEALDTRLDLRSRQETARARRLDVHTASSGLWPSVDVFASYTRYNNQSPYRFGSQESQNASIGYQVSWNVFDRLATWARRSQAKASARIAEYDLEQSRLDAQLEVRQLYNSLIEARERAQVSRETIVQAQEDLRLAQERFRVGAGTSLDLITAQVNLAQARVDEVQAICDFLIGRARLDRAVGRATSLPERP